jgi:hypothetical protein
LEIVVLPIIPDLTPTEKLSDLKKQMWDYSEDEQCQREVLIKDNLITKYKVAWKQRSEAMQAKLKTHEDFEQKDLNANCQSLLKEIKGIMYKFEKQRFIILSLNNAHCDHCS